MAETDPIHAFIDKYFEDNASDIAALNGRIALDAFELTDSDKSLLHNLWNPGVEVHTDAVNRRSLDRGGEDWTGAEFPCLLLHDLKAEKHKASEVYKEIAKGAKIGPYYLYGTSGAGKTRSIFEYLSHNKGFYLLSHDTNRNPGSGDLIQVMSTLKHICKICVPRDDGSFDMSISSQNYLSVQSWIWMLLYIRHRVHATLQDRLGRELTAHEWLLCQLYPDHFFGRDIFALVAKKFFREVLEGGLLLKIFDYEDFNSFGWHIFIDEAQHLLNQHKEYFVSKDMKTRRSSFSALTKGICEKHSDVDFKKHFRFPVFSGTGLSLSELQEESKSVMAKRPFYNADNALSPCFSGFKLLDEPAVKEYLKLFLDVSSISQNVMTHVAKWLRGRPRWSATFLEIYIMRRHQKSESRFTKGKFDKPEDSNLMEALDQYLNVMTRNPDEPSDRRKTWSAGPASAYAALKNFMRTDYEDAKEDLASAVFRLSVGGIPGVFKKETSQRIIQYGVGAVKFVDNTDLHVTGFLDEPIIVEAGINVFRIDNQLRDNLRRQTSGQGHAFERLLLPAFLRDGGTMRDLANAQANAQQQALLGNIFWSKLSNGTRSSYGVLSVDMEAKADKISATLDWIKASLEAKFEGQVPPFCFPVESFGPDIMFLLYDETYSDCRACLVQSKYRRDMNQQEALRTLVPEWLFFSNRDKKKKRALNSNVSAHHEQLWNTLKQKLVSDERPCIRMLVQYPVEATASANPGFLASNSSGTNETSSQAKRDLLLTLDGKSGLSFLDAETMSLVQILKKPRIS